MQKTFFLGWKNDDRRGGVSTADHPDWGEGLRSILDPNFIQKKVRGFWSICLVRYNRTIELLKRWKFEPKRNIISDPKAKYFLPHPPGLYAQENFFPKMKNRFKFLFLGFFNLKYH